MIVDRIENITKYPLLDKYADVIFDFIDRCDRGKLKEGRYSLLGDKIFALVQSFETKAKEGAKMESHKAYADLQYIHAGREIIYYDVAEELKIAEDRRPDADILFYDVREDKGGVKLDAGMFGYFAPQDAHMPCIWWEEGHPEKVVKIVFKIKAS